MNLSAVDALSTRLIGLGDWFHRTTVFAEYIQQASPELAACIFSELVVSAVLMRRKKYTVALQSAFFAVLLERWGSDHRTHTREAAAAWQDEVALAFLVNPTVDEDDEHFSVPAYNSERTLTLGERKALAATPQRRNIEMALFDPHPAVMGRLLDNPRVTEPDMIRIAARAKVPSIILAAIATHPRWRERLSVTAALAQNRRLPANIGLTLLPFLSRPTLVNISGDQRLHDSLRSAAALLLSLVTRNHHGCAGSPGVRSH